MAESALVTKLGVNDHRLMNFNNYIRHLERPTYRNSSEEPAANCWRNSVTSRRKAFRSEARRCRCKTACLSLRQSFSMGLHQDAEVGSSTNWIGNCQSPQRFTAAGL